MLHLNHIQIFKNNPLLRFCRISCGKCCGFVGKPQNIALLRSWTRFSTENKIVFLKYFEQLE